MANIFQKAVLIEKRIERPAFQASNRYYQTQSQGQVQSHQQVPQQNFGYRNFLDFGFFSNAAANFGGAPSPPGPNTRTIYVEKEIVPNNVIYQKHSFTAAHPGETANLSHNSNTYVKEVFFSFPVLTGSWSLLHSF